MAARRKKRKEMKRNAQPGGMSSKQMRQAMNQMNMETIDDVQEVVIRTSTHEYILENTEVQIMNMQGQEIYTITAGSTRKVTRGSAVAETSATSIDVKDSDVELIMKQSNVSKEKASAALQAANGDLAVAIMSLRK